jgi:cysteine desulfurase
MDEKVVNAMLPYFTENYGNASSRLHAYGWAADAAVEKAKEQVSALLGCETAEIIFTSGATESINLALKSVVETHASKGNHIITLCTEHSAVLDTCKWLESRGIEVTYLAVNREGLVDLDELQKAITPKTILVSVMAINNETGVIQPIERIGKLCKEQEVLFFTDATQQVGKIRTDVKEIGVDMMAFSAHKFYGPKGIGALYVRRKNPRVNLLPQIHGGGHQNNRRSGTLNVPLIVGLGAACELAQHEMWDNSAYISKLKNFFEHQLLEIEGLRINGSTRHRLFNTSNICFPKNYSISSLTNRYAFSSGSACASNKTEPSHVLRAMQMEDEDIKQSYRFSFGKYSTLEEIKQFLKDLAVLKQ